MEASSIQEKFADYVQRCKSGQASTNGLMGIVRETFKSELANIEPETLVEMLVMFADYNIDTDLKIMNIIYRD